LAERLATTLECTTDSFLTLDFDWLITYVNSQAEMVTGRSRDELLGRCFWECFPEVQGTRFEREYHRSATDNVMVEFEEYFPPLELWFEVRAYPNSDGLVIHFRDVTEKKERERELKKARERFELLSRATNDAVRDWVIDPDTVWWSEAFQTLFGYSADEIEPGIDSWRNRIRFEERDDVWASLQEALSSEVDSWSCEYTCRSKDGSLIQVLDRSLILRDGTKAVRLTGALTDITERKKLQAQFLRAQRLESIGTLAGGIAHDLNNVLAPVLMGVELLRSENIDEDTEETLKVIEDSARRGATLVKQVLSFARGMEGRKVDVRVDLVLEEVVRIARDTFPREITIQSEWKAGLWKINGDPTQIHQVLLNLCVNARDALVNRGWIKISAANIELDEQYAALVPEASPGYHVVLEVEDNGAGMEAQVLDKIFDPFFTTKELDRGTGLGLSTSLGIVRGHGGYIRVYSEPGKGTQFKIYLPAKPEPSTEVVGDETLVPVRGKGELILVVDDEESVRVITGRTLESHGYKVLLAEDGADALRVYSEHADEIAAVLTDIMMPIMDGVATIQVLRRLNPKLPIIAASGLTSNGKEAKVARLGVKWVLSKPYGSRELLQALDDALARKQNNAELSDDG
jgi:PAS domain S-box-containing protein